MIDHQRLKVNDFSNIEKFYFAYGFEDGIF